MKKLINVIMKGFWLTIACLILLALGCIAYGAFLIFVFSLPIIFETGRYVYLIPWVGTLFTACTIGMYFTPKTETEK
jgi:hypothetical protein